MKSDFALPIHPSTDPEFDDLLHPGQAFEHPQQVIEDLDLTVNEKRAILASWASDACAIEALPALRRPPGSRRGVTVDEILEALRTLDKIAQSDAPQAAWARRQVRRTAGCASQGRGPISAGDPSGATRLQLRFSFPRVRPYAVRHWEVIPCR